MVASEIVDVDRIRLIVEVQKGARDGSEKVKV